MIDIGFTREQIKNIIDSKSTDDPYNRNTIIEIIDCVLQVERQSGGKGMEQRTNNVVLKEKELVKIEYYNV